MCAKKLPFHLRSIRGSLGKQFCIKHYDFGVIMTKFPDMSRIIASESQRKCRNLFREAVKYARSVIRDKEQKKAWQKKLRRRNAVYNAAVKFYILKDKLARQRSIHLANKLISHALKNAFRHCDHEPALGDFPNQNKGTHLFPTRVLFSPLIHDNSPGCNELIVVESL